MDVLRGEVAVQDLQDGRNLEVTDEEGDRREVTVDRRVFNNHRCEQRHSGRFLFWGSCPMSSKGGHKPP